MLFLIECCTVILFLIKCCPGIFKTCMFFVVVVQIRKNII